MKVIKSENTLYLGDKLPDIIVNNSETLKGIEYLSVSALICCIKDEQFILTNYTSTSLDQGLLKIALSTLGSQVAVFDDEGHLCLWTYQEQIIEQDIVDAYGTKNKIEHSLKKIPVEILFQPDNYHIYVNGSFEGEAIVVFSKDALEIVFLFKTDTQVENLRGMDQKVEIFSSVDEINQFCKRTTLKMNFVLKILDSL